MIKNNYLILAFLSSALVSLSSCEVVGGIFKAGVWTGLIIVALVIAIVIWLISRAKK
ncbi:MAG: phosphatidate cytidylyltransferase [Flavitalea sp.]